MQEMGGASNVDLTWPIAMKSDYLHSFPNTFESNYQVAASVGVALVPALKWQPRRRDCITHHGRDCVRYLTLCPVRLCTQSPLKPGIVLAKDDCQRSVACTQPDSHRSPSIERTTSVPTRICKSGLNAQNIIASYCAKQHLLDPTTQVFPVPIHCMPLGVGKPQPLRL
ncbi:hypothetical protein VTI74DRAFT_11319 [Chaetomium olivicolor]